MNGTEDDDIFKEYNKDYNDLDIGVIHPDIPIKERDLKELIKNSDRYLVIE